MLIKEVHARKIKDSRNEATIEVSVNGSKASSPSGKSTGKYESGPYYRSLDFCVKFLNAWNDEIEINEFDDLKKVEKKIKRKLRLRDVKQFGGNSLFSFESAILKAFAKSERKELWEIINPKAKRIPVPVGNAVGGGSHSSSYKGHPTFQEFLIIPKGKNIKDNVKIMNKVYSRIGKKIKSKQRNDEGAWQTSLSEAEILTALGKYTSKIKIGLDVAASEFYNKGRYMYGYEFANREEQIIFINQLSKMFKIFYLEDPLQEEDFSGFSKINGMSVGDDLIATQIKRLKKAVKMKSVKGMIVKPNQNGSLIEVAEIFRICKENKIKTIMSHRSGETLDSSLADYAVGFGANYIKTGIQGKVRKVKLDRLITIHSKF